MKKSMRLPLSLIAAVSLSGCMMSGLSFNDPQAPQAWSKSELEVVEQTDVQNLQEWWLKFDDPALNKLINTAMVSSPDRAIAKARIMEARGIRRTTKSSLFPSLDARASGGRQDNGLAEDEFYEVGFDASYEIDIFGQNRLATKAANKNVTRLEEQYRNVTLSLIAEIARDYIDYRAAQKQTDIAKKNLKIQEMTSELIMKQYEFGEAPRLDVERAENLVNTTKAAIPEFERQASNARLRLSVLTGQMPEVLKPLLVEKDNIPALSVEPVLLAPANVISLRPDIRAASAYLESTSALTSVAIREIYPNFTLGGFFGKADSLLAGQASIWNVTVGAAMNLIDFGRIRGQIEAAKALETEAFELYRKTIIGAVAEVETALVDYTKINQQTMHLQKAYHNADKALKLSQTLYKEGEISFINVLESQRALNESETALVTVQSAKSQSIVRLYKALGVF